MAEVFANSEYPDQTLHSAASDLGSHCLSVCKNRFKMFARIFSRRHKQTTFSDAGFLGALRVNDSLLTHCSRETPKRVIGKQRRPIQSTMA